MKITKKILISALAISPLTTLAFIPSVVRPKEVITCGKSDYTLGIVKDFNNSKYVDIAKKLIKEFDMYMSVRETPSLAIKIVDKKAEIKRKILKEEREIEKIRKYGNNGREYNVFVEDLEMHRFYIDCLNNKLKTLEKIENELLTILMKDDYKESMKKYYSSEALKTLILKIRESESELNKATKNYTNVAKDSKDKNRESHLNYYDNKIKQELNKIKELFDHKRMLEKHFKLQ